jgi:uncharacterized membrane protein YheB (UPF0754 family)
MFIYLLYDKPWTIAAGGLIVGIITNAIAIKLIFEPVRSLHRAIYTVISALASSLLLQY